MTLSERIRDGCDKIPQTYGAMFNDEGACALGAAYFSYFGIKNKKAGIMNVVELFPILQKRMHIPCPQAKLGRHCSHPISFSLAEFIVHLNDYHMIARREIADLIETYEMNDEEIKIEESVMV